MLDGLVVGDMRLWRLEGRCPPVTAVIAVGRAARAAAMAAAQRLGRDRLPDILHHSPEGTAHLHVHWQAEDRDGDGLIDHLAARVPGGLDPAASAVLDAMADGQLTLRGGVRLRLASMEGKDRTSRMWASTTPFVGPRQAWNGPGRPKSGLDVASQLRCELERLVWLPPPDEIWAVPSRRPDLAPWLAADPEGTKPPHHAVAGRFVVRFPHAVAGPVAAGFLSHWGLGAFIALDRLSGPATEDHLKGSRA
jgi:hypothetical protein